MSFSDRFISNGCTANKTKIITLTSVMRRVSDEQDRLLRPNFRETLMKYGCRQWSWGEEKIMTSIIESVLMGSVYVYRVGTKGSFSVINCIVGRVSGMRHRMELNWIVQSFQYNFALLS